MLPIEKVISLYASKSLTELEVYQDLDVYRVQHRTGDYGQGTINNLVSEYSKRGFSVQDSLFVISMFDEAFNPSDLADNPSRQTQREIPTQDQLEGTVSSNDINVIGKFMMNNEDGSKTIYQKNDVVYYEGKTYIAGDTVSGWVPESMHPENNWNPIDLPDSTIDGEEF